MSDPIDPHRPVPSITAQRPEVQFIAIPRIHQLNNQYFNPGLVDWHGKRWLVTRKRRLSPPPGKNSIVMWPFSGGFIPPAAMPQAVKFYSIRMDEHFEDPRAINIDGELHISYSTFHTRGRYVAQGFAQINAVFQAARITMPVYGSNGPKLELQTGNEKNWTWFHDVDPNLLRFVYQPAPRHTVVTVHQNGGLDESHSPGISWAYGLPRGGTPPVFVPASDPTPPPFPQPFGKHTRRKRAPRYRHPIGLWWSFFHSSIDISPFPPRRRYYLGAYAFEPEPPFRPVLVTPEPILVGSEADPREKSAPYCVFPCGALNDKGTWSVSLGVNDVACALMKITAAELETLTVPIV